MKTLLMAVLSLLACALSIRAQVITVNPTELHGGTLPGSPSEYVIFNGTEYNKIGGDAPGTYKNLPDFEIIGGEHEQAGNANTSTISTPGGVASLLTGGIFSTNTIAVGIDLLGTISPTGFAADGFNFNNFNLYVMVDNYPTNGAFNDISVSLDARLNSAELPAVTFTLTSHNSSLTSADYVEYNVTGLGTAVAAAKALHPTAANDLVLRIMKSTGKSAEFGGLGFESVPEPSTWAMIFLGGAGMVFIARRRKLDI